VKDERIVSLVKKGKKEEYGRLVEKYEKSLERYISHLINQKGEEVEDLVQDCLIKAYENLEDFEERKKFSSWIFRIAHNLVVDYFRKKRLKTERIGEETWNEPEDGLNIEEEFIKGIERGEVYKAINKLEIEEKEILVLFYDEEKSYEEIGEILRINKSNVGIRLMRSKEKLKKLLDNKI